MDPFVGEIRLFSFSRIPKGWALCDGSILQIRTYNALYALLGTVYGGDGKTTFGLPDLRGRVPVGFGQQLAQGGTGGQESVTLTPAQLPPHTHLVNAYSTPSNSAAVNSAFPAACAVPTGATTSPPAPNLYSNQASANVVLAPSSVAAAAQTTAHENRQLSIALNYCIAVTGIFPSRP